MQSDPGSQGAEDPASRDPASQGKHPQDEWRETGVVLRQAEKADLDTLVRLQSDLIALLHELRPIYYRPTPAAARLARRYFLSALDSQEWAVYLAEDASRRAVGYIALFLYHRPGLFGGGLEAHIDDLYVADDYRHHGIGESLLEVAGIWATAMSAERLTLWVESNNEPAKAFYLAHGFLEYEKFMVLELDHDPLRHSQ